MNLTQAIAFCKEKSDVEMNTGWIFVNDDKEFFWSNERPSRFDGWWGNNTRSFYTVFLGKFTGEEAWQESLREVL